jgi:hypothetical protein
MIWNMPKDKISKFNRYIDIWDNLEMYQYYAFKPICRTVSLVKPH